MPDKPALVGLLAAYNSDSDDEAASASSEQGVSPQARVAPSSPQKRAAESSLVGGEPKKRRIIVDDLVPLKDADSVEEEPKLSKGGPTKSIFAALPAPKTSRAPANPSTTTVEVLKSKERVSLGSQADIPTQTTTTAVRKATTNFFGDLRGGPPNADIGPGKSRSTGFFSLPTRTGEPVIEESLPEDEKGQHAQKDESPIEPTFPTYEESGFSNDLYAQYDHVDDPDVEGQTYELDEAQLRRIHGKAAIDPSALTFKEIRQADQTQKNEWEAELAREMGDRPFANPFGVGFAALQLVDTVTGGSKCVITPQIVKNTLGDKRRHGILSLAREAKAREAQLEQQWSSRKAARKASGAQYGF